MSSVKLNRTSERHLHVERLALELSHLGASLTTIIDLIGVCPTSARVELRSMGDGRKKTRIGKNVSFLHRNLISFRIANKLWLYYATLRQDPNIKKNLEVELMLSAFNFALMEFDCDIGEYVDFNRFSQLLMRIKDGTIMVEVCDCGNSYILRSDRIPTHCPDCMGKAKNN